MQNPKALAKHIHVHLEQDPTGVGQHLADLRDVEVADVLNFLSRAEAAKVLTLLPLPRAIRVCDQPTLRRRGKIVEQLDPELAVKILEALPADQRTDVIRQLGPHACHRLLPKLGEAHRAEVEQLLKYPPRSAGGIMTTEFVRLDPSMTVGRALKHIRAVAREKESIYACYILEPGTGKLLGAVSLRDLVMAEFEEPVTEVMRPKPITVGVRENQESVAQKIGKYNLLAVPVLEDDGRVVGFVTVDDVIDVLNEEQTKEALRFGGVEPGSLDLPYVTTPFLSLVRMRATWLIILFLGEMFTATAMGYFDEEIKRATVLALFIPLIISSGGNSGSQAASLIIRALALGEVGLREWWLVMRREIYSGLVLGGILGVIGFLRIILWSEFTDIYGAYPILIGLTVAFSLVGIVLWGTLSGSMLPFILKRCGVDPATSSAPFVATLVDVTGLVIYFTVAMLILRGTYL